MQHQAVLEFAQRVGRPLAFLRGRDDGVVSGPLKRGIWGWKAENSVPGSDAVTWARNTEPETCGTSRAPGHPERQMPVGWVVKS